MVKTGHRVVRFQITEGELEVIGGTVINENTGVAGQEVCLVFDDGVEVNIPQDAASKLKTEGCCIACDTLLAESARFCAKCGAANVVEAAERVAPYLGLTESAGTPADLEARLVAAAKSRFGANVGRARILTAAA